MKRIKIISMLGLCLVLLLCSPLIQERPRNIEKEEYSFSINGQEAYVSVSNSRGFFSITLDGKNQPLVITNFETIFDRIGRPYTPRYQYIINNSPGVVITNNASTQPFIIENSPNAQIINVTVTDIINDTFSAISLYNCPNSVIKNVTIQNITSTSSLISAFNITKSDGTIISNCTIKKVFSNGTNFFTPRIAYGIYIDSSKDIQITNVSMEELYSITSIFGLFSVDSPNLMINYTDIHSITSMSSYGMFFVNSSSSTLANSSLTGIVSNSLNSSGIYIRNSPFWILKNTTIMNINSTSHLTGINCINSSSTLIENNSISELRSTGFQKEIAAIKVLSSNKVMLSNNSLISIIGSSSKSIGIWMAKSDDFLVKWNNIHNLSSNYKSADGFLVDSCTNSNFTDNLVNQVISLSDQYLIPRLPDSKDITGYGFFIRNSTSLKIDWNTINLTKVWLYVDETSSGNLFNNNTLNALNIGLTSITCPNDLNLEEGKIGYLSWIISNEFPSNYEIYRNGDLIYNSTQLNSTSDYIINITIAQNLTVGTYCYQLVYTEQNGNFIRDYALVSISEITPPLIIEKPEEYIYTLYGSPVEGGLNWIISDLHPATYAIYQNGTEIKDGNWTSTINISVGVLILGTHNFTLVVKDSSGNQAKDSVFIRVLLSTDIFIVRNTAELIEFKVNSQGNFLNWSIVSIEDGTYHVYRDTIKIQTSAFSPNEPILISIDNLDIGTYIFKLQIIDNFGNTAEDTVTVSVIANLDIQTQDITRSGITTPSLSSPPYLGMPPGNPLPTLIGLFSILTLLGGGSYLTIKRITTPKVVRENQIELKRFKKLKDKSGEAKKLKDLSKAYAQTGNYKDAVKTGKKALSKLKEIGDKKGEMESLETIGDAYLAIGADKKYE